MTTITPYKQQLLEAEYLIRTFVVNVPQGLALKDVLKFEFWTVVKDQLKQGDEIILRAEDGAWSARVEVITVNPEGPALRLLYSTEPEKVVRHKDVVQKGNQTIVKGQYTVSFNPAQKWRVVRNSDNLMCIDGLPNRDRAVKWALDQVKSEAA